MSCEQLIDTLLKTCDIKCKICGEVQTVHTDLVTHLKKCQKVTLKYSENQELIAERTKSWLLSKIIEENLKINLQHIISKPDEITENSQKPEKKERKKLKKQVRVVKTEGSNSDEEKISQKLEEIKKKSEVEFTYKKKELLDRLSKLSKEPLNPELPLLRLHILYHYGPERWEKVVRSHYSQISKTSASLYQHFSCIELSLLNKFASLSPTIEEDIKNFEKALYSYHGNNAKTFSPALVLDNRVFFLPIATMIESYFEHNKKEHFLWVPNDDDLRFYVKGEDSWNLDWALEITILNLHQDLIGYLTSLFRNKYREVFSDNYYRTDFMKFFKEGEGEVKQLLSNLLYVTDYSVVEKDFQRMVRSRCPGQFKTDAKIPMGVVPKKVNKISFSQKEMLEKLFDSIGEEEIKEFRKNLEDNFSS